MSRKPSVLRTFLHFSLALSLTASSLLAAPYFGETFTYHQPDGQSFEVKLFGDEYFAYQETMDGYLIIRDPQSGFLCYANVSPDGSEIISTGVKVGQAKPLGIEKKQRLGRGMEMEKSLGNRNLLGADEKGRRNPGRELKVVKGRGILNVARKVSPQDPAPIDEGPRSSAPTSGDEPTSGSAPLPPQSAPPSAPTINKRVGLVLLASFPDRPGDRTKTVADIDNYCNAETYTVNSNATSVYGYFKIQSNGKLEYKNNVTAWFTAANPRSYYTDNAVGHGTRARDLIKEGLAVLKAQGFDFIQCDGNGDGKLDGVNIFYAGSRVNNWSEGIWPHQSSSSWSGLAGSGLSSYSYDYQITDMPANLTIGTFCHENGHMICDFPDLYAYSTIVNGVTVINASNMGDFSLMASSGSNHPRHVDPYLKIHAGWADVVDITSMSHQLGAVQQDRNFFYRYRNPARPQEYFLFENRGNAGYEGPWGGARATNPANGLVVYHALETGSNTSSTIVTADAVTDYTRPYEVMVVEALPSTNVTPWYDDPTPGTNDAFTSSGVSSISDNTLPDLKFWASDGRTVASGANIHTISAAGANMTFVIGAGALPATPATGVTATQFEPNVDSGQNAASQTFSVFNSGGDTLSYTISDNVAWLDCSVVSGTATTEADTVTVSYTTSTLAPGSYPATITIDGGTAGTKTINISLTIYGSPALAVAPGSFTKQGVAGSSGLQFSFNLSNTGEGTATYTITKTQSWLLLDRTNGTVSSENDLITVSLNASALTAGDYNDTITITATGSTNSPLTIPVSFNVDSTGMVLQAPNGGGSWIRGALQRITWSSVLSGNVKIELFKAGSLQSTITSSTANNGSYVWAIPAGLALASDYKIRVASVETPAETDISFSNFSIIAAPTVNASLPYNEGFESGIGTWVQSSTDAINWTRDSAGTPTSSTGPSTGQGPSTWYLFTEASGYYDSLAELNCWFDFRASTNPELTFYYHMYGSQMGKLELVVSNDGVTWDTLFSDSGNKGDMWNLATVDLSQYAGQYLKIAFRGTTGGGNASDMAIDNINIDESGTIDHFDITSIASPQTVNQSINGITITAKSASGVTVANFTGKVTYGGTAGISGTSANFVGGILSANLTPSVVGMGRTLTVNDGNGATGSTTFSVASLNAPTVNAGADQTAYLSGTAWSPISLSPALWLDADDSSSMSLIGNKVSQWNDKSGNVRHALQATDSYRPTLTSAALNGKNILTFDGNSDYFDVNLEFMVGTDHSVFVVTKPTLYNDIYGAANPSAGASSLHVGFNSSSQYRMNYWGNDWNTGITANFQAATTNLINFVWLSGATKEIFANGKSEGTRTGAGVVATMSGGGRIGKIVNHGHYGGDIAEFIAFAGTVSANERQALEGFLAHKWGTTNLLAANHPYKTQSPSNANAAATLAGTGSDLDGGSLTYTWSKVSGPGSVSFTSPNSANSSANFTVTGTYVLRLTVSDGVLETFDDIVVTVNLATPFIAWSGSPSATADSSGDGINNGIAWVLGAADASTNATALLPIIDNVTDPNNIIFTYRRSDTANANATKIKVEYSSNLTNWTEALDSDPDVIITETNDYYEAGVDKVEVKILRSVSVGQKLFSRLSVEIAP